MRIVFSYLYFILFFVFCFIRCGYISIIIIIILYQRYYSWKIYVSYLYVSRKREKRYIDSSSSNPFQFFLKAWLKNYIPHTYRISTLVYWHCRIRIGSKTMPVPRKMRKSTMGGRSGHVVLSRKPSMREVRASASASLGNKKSVAQRELIQKSRKMALVSPIKRQQMRRIQTREGRVCGTLVPPIIIKPHKTEKVKKYKGHDRGDAKRLSSKDRAARASQRLLVLKDLLKLKLLSSSQNRSLSRQDYHTFGTAFRKMDTNGDGVVDYDELAEALGPDGMNIGLREGEIFGLAREFDSDGNGTIDIEEFFHTLADLDAPDNHIPGILAECKKRELQNYTLKLVAIGEMMKRGKTVASRGEAVDAGVDVAPPGENANNGDGPPLDGDGPTTTLEQPAPAASAARSSKRLPRCRA